MSDLVVEIPVVFYAVRIGNFVLLIGRWLYSSTSRRYSRATFRCLRCRVYSPTGFTVPRILVSAVSQSFMSTKPNQVNPTIGTPSSRRRSKFIHSFQSHSTAYLLVRLVSVCMTGRR